MDRVFFDAMAAGDQRDDTADVARDIGKIGHRKAIGEIPADDLVLTEVDDLEIVLIVAVEVMLHSGRRTVQFVLQRLSDFDADK